VPSFFIAQFSLTVSFCDLYFYINAHLGNKDIIKSSKEIYSIIKLNTFISCNCSSVGSPSVVLLKGKLSVQGFEGCQSPGSPPLLNGRGTVDYPNKVPV
jgi:hypothetical protein